MAEKKILILGGGSYIGRHLCNSIGKDHAIATYHKKPINNGICFDSLSMDLSDILKNFDAISHAVILLGDTNPETCAKDIEKSTALNVDSIKTIINCLKLHQITPVFCSSEFVFDGVKGNYTEEDPVNPILIYGKQKVEIEKYIQNTCEHFIIVRFSKVFGSEKGDGTIFTNWLDAINNNEKISCACDQVFSPICIEDVTRSIIDLINNDCNGIFHISGRKTYNRIESS